MSMFQRKGTVSKSSGPVHVNSYALRGVPIRYTPPFFLPDQLSLPASWSMPTLPSDQFFRYDYTKERKVLEQARIRTISLAAEAQAREKREKAEEEKRRIEAAAAAERAKVMTSTAELPPPLIPAPGSTLLTPSPAPQPTLTKAPPTNNTDTATAVPNDSSSGMHAKDSRDIVKPLGEMSLSEFESDNFNPFDTASLQAINDMEILQTISLAPPTQGDSPPRPGGPAESERNMAGSQNPGQSVVPPLSSSVAPVTSVAPTVPFQHQESFQFTVVPLPSIGGSSSSSSQPGLAPLTTGLLGSSPESTQASTTLPSSAPVHVPSISPLPHPSLSTLPVLPPIGSILTHSRSDTTHTTIPSSNQQLSSSSSQPTFPPYPLPRPQGTPPQPSSDTPPITSTHSQPSMAPYPSLAGLALPPTGTQFTPLPGTSPTAVPSYLPPSSVAGGLPPSSMAGGLPPSSVAGGLPPSSMAGGLSPSSMAGGLPPSSMAGGLLPSSMAGGLPPSSVAGGLPPSSMAGGLPPSSMTGGGGIHSDSGGEVATLVNLGGNAATTASPPAPQPAKTPPVPKPRTIPATATAAATPGQQVPNNAHLPYPTGPAAHPNPSPMMTGAAPQPPARPSIQARASGLMASLPQGQPPLSRPGLGVAVLPPIPARSSTSPSSQHPSPPSHGHPPPSSSSSSNSTPALPVPYPPPYQAQSPTSGEDRAGSPPPPYYPSPHGDNDAASRRFSQPVPLPSQQHTPSHFTLPDPRLTLSPDQRSKVESMAGMGFPAPRVARAIRRLKGNHTEVVDFLILVGGLEDSSKSKGDSAEVALLVCDSNVEKAKRYLVKVNYYKESGFSEKSIHEAYEKAGKDWDRALDILTQNSS